MRGRGCWYLTCGMQLEGRDALWGMQMMMP